MTNEPTKKFLIITSETGGGHASAASAIADGLKRFAAPECLVNIVRAATSGDSAVNVDIDLSSIPFFGGNDPFGKRGNRRMTGWV